MYSRTAAALCALITLVTLTAAGSKPETGAVTGTIVDRDSGDPVVGASVLVVGTRFGAMSDLAGEFTLTMLRPGNYDLRFTHIDHNTVEVTGVTVVADTTITIVVRMSTKATALDKTIQVIAGRDVIRKFETSNQLSINGKEIEKKPVPTIQYMLNERAGGQSGSLALPPAHGGTAIVNGLPFDAMFFKHYGVNPFVDTEDDHLSTFAVDVDDGSFSVVRSYLDRHCLPPAEAVRVEEFINHFDYAYPSPEARPFAIHIDGAPSRFGGSNVWMLRIGIKGAEIRPENRKAANLVFVIDISGSMAREDRLGLVKKALRLLVAELTPDDHVGIVVYGSRGKVLLQPTSISEKNKILDAINALRSGGSTCAEEGLRLGYDMAASQFEADKINRIILCSDGVANVGVTGADGILEIIKDRVDRGITLSAIGFGMGNYNDILMEKLGDKGNGHYAYVDNIDAARRIFVDNLTGTLQVIARDVKIQVDFDPETVRSYRLLGYENRDVDDDKFRDDTEDGGEIGSGHSVTALYEVKFHEGKPTGTLGTVFVRYKDASGSEVAEVNRPITADLLTAEFDAAPAAFRLAAATAEFAEQLRGSYWARNSEMSDVLSLVAFLQTQTDDPQIAELLGMIARADHLQQRLSVK